MTSSRQHGIWIFRTSPLAAKTALAIAILLALTVVATPSAQAQTFNVIYNFTGGLDGWGPFAGLIMDQAGNLYGTTYVAETMAAIAASSDAAPFSN